MFRTACTGMHFTFTLWDSALALSILSGHIKSIFTKLTLKYCLYCYSLFLSFWTNSPQLARASWFTIVLDHTQRRTTVGRTPLDEWSARCRDLHLTTHNTHNRQTSMLLVWFKPTISASKGLQTYALDRAVVGTDSVKVYKLINSGLLLSSQYLKSSPEWIAPLYVFEVTSISALQT